MSRLMCLNLQFFPSTAPLFQWRVSPLRTAWQSWRRLRVKAWSSGCSFSSSAAWSQSSRRSPCRPVRIFANSATWRARAPRGGQAGGGGEDPGGGVGGPGGGGGGGGERAVAAEGPQVAADRAVAAAVAEGPCLGVQGGGAAAALVPAPGGVGFVGGEGGRAAAPGAEGGGEDLVGARGAGVEADGGAGQPGVPGDRGGRVALGEQLPDLLVAFADAAGQGLVRPGPRGGPGGGGGGGLFQAAAVPAGGLLHLLAEVVPQVPAVGDLERAGGAAGGAGGVAAGPVAADHRGRGAGAASQPAGQDVAVAARQQVDDLVRFHVHQDGGLVLALADGDVVDSEDRDLARV